jgi:hypothetical protein
VSGIKKKKLLSDLVLGQPDSVTNIQKGGQDLTEVNRESQQFIATSQQAKDNLNSPGIEGMQINSPRDSIFESKAHEDEDFHLGARNTSGKSRLDAGTGLDSMMRQHLLAT